MTRILSAIDIQSLSMTLSRYESELSRDRYNGDPIAFTIARLSREMKANHSHALFIELEDTVRLWEERRAMLRENQKVERGEAI